MHAQLWSLKASGAQALFLLACVVYIWGIAPTISWRDASEFVTVAHTLGISHPAGSPTYALLAKPATFLPLGSIAFRVNLASAVFAALTVSLLFSLLYDMLTATPQRMRFFAAVCGATSLLVSESFWRFAEVAEVYTLQNCFLVLLITVLLKARSARTYSSSASVGYYWLFALLYGLSAGIHATMAFFVPGFLIFMGCTEPRMFTPKRLAFLAFFFLLGFAVYVYLPMRSLGEPAFDWGDPETWYQFLGHISDRKDAAVHFSYSWWKLPHQVRVYVANLSNEFSTFGLVLGFLGWIALLRKDKLLGIFLSLIFLGNVAFFIQSWTAAFGFIPSFVVFSIWIGYGVYTCFHLLGLLYRQYAPRFPRAAVSTFLVASLMIMVGQTFVRHVEATNHTGDYSAALYGRHLLEQLPSDALLFSHYAWFPLLYLQQVEQRRPDVTVMLQGEVFSPRHFAFLSKKRFPNVGLITSPERMVISTVDYFWMFCKLNGQDHPLFWDADEKYQRILEEYLHPQGLLFAFDPSKKVDITPRILQTHWDLLSGATKRILQGTPDKESRLFMANKLNLISAYFKKRGFDEMVAKTYQAGLQINPDDMNLHNNYGNFLMSHGDFQAALEHFNAAYNKDPVSPMINKNIGRLLVRLGDYAQAADFFEHALKLGAIDADVYAQLGEAYARVGRFSEATRVLQSALGLLTEDTAQHDADERLQNKIAWVQEQLQRLEALTNGNSIPHGSDG